MIAIPRRTIHLYPGELRDLLSAARAPVAEQRALLAAFEDQCARNLGVRHALPVGSGRLGLRLILGALDVGAGDEVLVPAFTDASVPQAVRGVGAVPVFVDVERRTCNLDPAGLAAARTTRTRAIIATHIFGAPCDMAAITRFASEHGIEVVEDCAHAIDASTRAGRCGTLGRAAIFSFVVTKAVNTFGGGLVATSDPGIAAHVRRATAALPRPDRRALVRRVVAGYGLAAATRPRVFGWLGAPALRGMRLLGGDVIRAYDRLVRPSTINANVDNAFDVLQAAVGLRQLRDLARTQSTRRRYAARILAALPPHVRAQTVCHPADEHAYYFCVATTPDPDRLSQQLLAGGVDTGRHPMRNVAALADPVDGPRRFPEAEFVHRHAVQLPIHPSLTDREIAHIERALRALQ